MRRQLDLKEMKKGFQRRFSGVSEWRLTVPTKRSGPRVIVVGRTDLDEEQYSSVGWIWMLNTLGYSK